MSIAIDNYTTQEGSTNQTISFSHECIGSNNLGLLVFVQLYGNATTVTGITYDTHPMTLVRADTGLGCGYAAVYSYLTPVQGTKTIAVTLSQGIETGREAIIAVSFTGCNQTTITGATFHAGGSMGPATNTIDSTVDNSLLIQNVGAGTADGEVYTFTDQTKLWEYAASDSLKMGGAYRITTTPGTYNMYFSMSNQPRGCEQEIIEVLPAATHRSVSPLPSHYNT